MKLSRTDRWILSNQLKILEFLDEENQDYYKDTREILERGYESLYDGCVQFIYPDHETFSKEKSDLVLNILSMFSAITTALEKIDDKSGINGNMLVFSGFGGNNEGDYLSFTRFFCTKYRGGERFSEIGTGLDNFNSHAQFLNAYRRMLEVWDKCKDKYDLSKEDLIEIGRAAIHPENRK